MNYRNLNEYEQFVKDTIDNVREYLDKDILCIKTYKRFNEPDFKEGEFYPLSSIRRLAHIEESFTLYYMTIRYERELGSLFFNNTELNYDDFKSHFKLITKAEYRKEKIAKVLNS